MVAVVADTADARVRRSRAARWLPLVRQKQRLDVESTASTAES